MPTVLLTYYCAFILLASIVGGMIPVWFQLTHRWMQFAVSFVAGVMLGVGVLHMLPHAIVDATRPPPASHRSRATPSIRGIDDLDCLAGMLAMFFIERFFCFHHHDVPDEDTELATHDHDHHAGYDHDHDHGRTTTIYLERRRPRA